MGAQENKKTKEAQTKKENQDFPNVSSSSDKVADEKKLKAQIKKTSKLNPDGKTDNTDKKSEN